MNVKTRCKGPVRAAARPFTLLLYAGTGAKIYVREKKRNIFLRRRVHMEYKRMQARKTREAPRRRGKPKRNTYLPRQNPEEKSMNGIANFGGNGCLWILILLLVLCCSQSGILNGILDSCYLPVILAVLYCMCKKGGFANLFGGCGCK